MSTNVYVCENNNHLQVYASFTDLQMFISSRYREHLSLEEYESNKKETKQDREVCYVSTVLDIDIDIYEFNFDENEPLSLMKCSCPSSECCFIQKKSRDNFWKESMSYMMDTMNGLRDNDTDISIVIGAEHHYLTKTVSLIYADGTASDLMTFRFIYDII